jgi:hypothetical protein
MSRKVASNRREASSYDSLRCSIAILVKNNISRSIKVQIIC